MAFISYETSKNMLELLSISDVCSEKVFLNDALDRILSEDIVAQKNDPQMPTSAMDGYAVLAKDIKNGAEILILGDNPAGHDETREVKTGICIKTFTGSMMPKGADTLIPIENVVVNEGKTNITITEEVTMGFAVRPIAESYAKGDVLIKKGTKVGFAEIGVMAGLNVVMPSVAIKPNIAIVATGSEILEIGEEAQNPSQIRSSNNYTLQAITQSAGCDVKQLGIVKDDKNSIMSSFENALASSDILVSTGGVSVGDYDFVKDIIPRLGAEVIYKGVNIKPGQHIMVARRDNKFIVALPGFAYSSTVTFILYVLPLIKKLLGQNSSEFIFEATLKENFKKRSRKSEFTACNITFDEGRYWVDFEGKKVGSSAILTNMLGECALMMTGEADGNLEAGMSVNVMMLDKI
jgi:molybdopterin molybdotransferase